MKLNKKTSRDFSILIDALGIDETDLLDYLNWCLLEQLVSTFSQDKQRIANLKIAPDGMAQFKKEVENRTRMKDKPPMVIPVDWSVDTFGKMSNRAWMAEIRKDLVNILTQ